MIVIHYTAAENEIVEKMYQRSEQETLPVCYFFYRFFFMGDRKKDLDSENAWLMSEYLCL